MEIETQTFKHLNIVEVIQKINSNLPLCKIKKPESNKNVFPYVELYNSQVRNRKKPPTFVLKYHQNLFSLNNKLKAKEFAHFHHQTIKSDDSLIAISPLIGPADSLAQRKSKYLKSKDFLVSKSVEYRTKKQKKEFGQIFIIGSKPAKANEKIPSHFKLPSLGEIVTAKVN